MTRKLMTMHKVQPPIDYNDILYTSRKESRKGIPSIEDYADAAIEGLY